MRIDFHSHFFPLTAVSAASSPVQVTERSQGDGYDLDAAGHKFVLDSRMFDIEQQLADQKRQQLDQRALMVPPFTVLYELPVEAGIAWSKQLNDGIAAAVASHPDALLGFATVPLQDAEAAARELDRAVSTLGMRGVEILTSVNGMGLDRTELDPFWMELERTGLPALVHPHNVSGAERMGDYHLRNLIGNPAETAQAGARLLFAGVLERFPHLKIILSHGGGALPNLIGRLRQGFTVRPECRTRAEAPIEHLRHLYFDTVVFDPIVLRHLVEIVGASQVVLGTDYPFDMSENDPVGAVEKAHLTSPDTDIIVNRGERLLAVG